MVLVRFPRISQEGYRGRFICEFCEHSFRVKRLLTEEIMKDVECSRCERSTRMPGPDEPVVHVHIHVLALSETLHIIA